jgi:pimeloyl-ACP methyl ester carboxylesterase
MRFGNWFSMPVHKVALCACMVSAAAPAWGRGEPGTTGGAKPASGGNASPAKSIKAAYRATPKVMQKTAQLGKLEEEDVLPDLVPSFRKWRESVMVEKGRFGNRRPVAYAETGAQDHDPLTILHFHGASVRPDNILLWRIVQSLERMGASARVVAPSLSDSKTEEIIQNLTAKGDGLIVMGHSAGASAASSIAAQHADQILTLATFGGGAASGASYPELHFHGTNDNGVIAGKQAMPGQGAFRPYGDGQGNIALDGADHSLRISPGGGGHYGDAGGDEHRGKAVNNNTAASAQLIDGVLRAILTSARDEKARRQAQK